MEHEASFDCYSFEIEQFPPPPKFTVYSNNQLSSLIDNITLHITVSTCILWRTLQVLQLFIPVSLPEFPSPCYPFLPFSSPPSSSPTHCYIAPTHEKESKSMFMNHGTLSKSSCSHPFPSWLILSMVQIRIVLAKILLFIVALFQRWTKQPCVYSHHQRTQSHQHYYTYQSIST